ncbi:MAG: universal stress protein [Bdellovibrionaceae bacterium]|nr:universal stress protein [Pseudobdellovibrionaceae bacterium]MBX3033289.1 universal stress protein [Pseudobdellovibrionaceae bacterium]
MEHLIWAVDAFEEPVTGNRAVLESLKSLAQVSPIRVTPVYILGPVESALPLPRLYGDPAWMPEVRKAAERRLKEILPDKSRAPFLEEPQVIVHSATNIEEAVSFFASYAKSQRADALVVRSHGRTGVERFFVGSFAESLLFHSETPVFVFGAHAKKWPAKPHILLATDFGDHAKSAFRQTMRLSNQWGAHLTLFHAVAPPIEGGVDLEAHSRLYEYQGEFVSLRQILEDQIKHQTERAEAWTEWALRDGIAADYMIDESGAGVENTILEASRRREISLIVMSAQSGPVISAILGSLTRRVIRGATCPVLVYPRKYFESLGKEADSGKNLPRREEDSLNV